MLFLVNYYCRNELRVCFANPIRNFNCKMNTTQIDITKLTVPLKTQPKPDFIYNFESSLYLIKSKKINYPLIHLNKLTYSLKINFLYETKDIQHFS